MFVPKLFLRLSRWCTLYRRPFFGKIPSVQFPVQRYTGVWSISRSPHSPQSNFNRRKRVGVSCLSDVCRHSYDFHENRTRQGRNSHTMFVQKLFLRLSRWCTLYRRVPGKVKCPNFPLAETGWLPLAEPVSMTANRPETDLTPDLSDPGEPGDDKMRVGKLETTGTTSGNT